MTRTTRDSSWRPHYGERVRLVELPPEQPHGHIAQAAVGDIVKVSRILSPPSPGMLWLTHWEGENAGKHMLTFGYLAGTYGHWEEVPDNTLAHAATGTTLDRLTAEDRVAVLVEALLGLREEERRVVVERIGARR